MPTYYHGGPEAVDPELYAVDAVSKEESEVLMHRARLHHPLTHPARESIAVINGEKKLKIPPMFCPLDRTGESFVQQYAAWEPGSISLGLVGRGFWVVPPGGSVNLDPAIPVEDIKAVAPHLLTEDEWKAAQAKKQKQQLNPIEDASAAKKPGKP